ncbi:SseB family protein [Cryptosporangium arvum]|uniref:SseB family protein n=1 Tax=Cryptosporangium arvum TaxID=80871 RepID=UPI0004B58A3F|nr:SseB family protein [Cryptosporangium arvum]
MTESAYGAAAWQPANETELLMHHALLRQHTQRYFQLAAGATLYLPATTEPARRLHTRERDGRTQLLAFTSAEGVARVIGRGADTVLRVGYPLLVRDWPDEAWWLALNPALPIEAVLPVTAVGSIASGELDVVPPTPPEMLVLPGGDLDDTPADELEEQLATAMATRNSALILDLLVLADVLLPTLRPVSEPAFDDPYFPWAAMPLIPELPVDGPALGVFTSEQRLSDATLGASVPTVRTSLLELAAAWPDAEYTMLVNPHTSLEVRLSGEQVALLAEWVEISALYYERVPS